MTQDAGFPERRAARKINIWLDRTCTAEYERAGITRL